MRPDTPDRSDTASGGARGEDAPTAERRFRDADRGQLILISGLIVAVALVTLVVLLNASIYSENVATRGIESADGEALEVRAAVVEEVGALVDGTNRNGPADHDAAVDAVDDGIDDLDAYLARAYADRGGVTHVTADRSEMERGSYVTGDLTDAGTGDSNATLAADVSRTRGFVAAVDAGSLAPTDTSGAPGDAFRVEYRTATESREVYVYEGVSDGNVTVAVGENGNDPTVVCSMSASGSVDLDLTGGSLGDERCPGLWNASAGDLSAPYDVRIERTDEATGDAALTVLPDIGDTVSSDHTVDPAVYDATVRVSYRTAELRFETTVRVAPGEPDA